MSWFHSGRRSFYPFRCAVMIGLLTAVAFMTGCGPELGAELGTIHQAAILGDDSRTPLTESELGAMVGTLRSAEDKALCTGFFSGIKEVTTAHHCLGERWAGEGQRFVTADKQEYWVLGLKRWNKESDLVVLNVERPTFGGAVEQTQKFLVTRPMVSDRSAIIISFDPKRSEFLVNEGTAPVRMADHPGVLSHELDTIPGSSGSPIIQGDSVVAMHVGFQTEKMTDAERAKLTQEPSCSPGATAQVCQVAEPKVISNVAIELVSEQRAVLGALPLELHLECFFWGYPSYSYSRYSYGYSNQSYYGGYGYSRYWGGGGYGGRGYGYSSYSPYGAYYGRYYSNPYSSYYGQRYSSYYGW